MKNKLVKDCINDSVLGVVGHSVWYSMMDSIWRTSRLSTSKKVWNYIWDHLWDYICSSICKPVLNTAWGSVKEYIRNYEE